MIVEIDGVVYLPEKDHILKEYKKALGKERVKTEDLQNRLEVYEKKYKLVLDFLIDAKSNDWVIKAIKNILK